MTKLNRLPVKSISWSLAVSAVLFTLAMNAMAGPNRGFARPSKEEIAAFEEKFTAACGAEVSNLCPDVAAEERGFLKVACLKGQVSRVGESCKAVLEAMPARPPHHRPKFDREPPAEASESTESSTATS